MTRDARKSAARRITSPRMLPARAYVVSLASLLAGASCVHRVAKPDLTIPKYGTDATTTR